MVPATISVLAEIRDERLRQVEAEGWTPDHDDMHESGELALAAGCYALVASPCINREGLSPPYWPFGSEWWKPESRRRDLVKAAALIVAEIERLDRADAKSGGVS